MAKHESQFTTKSSKICANIHEYSHFYANFLVCSQIISFCENFAVCSHFGFVFANSLVRSNSVASSGTNMFVPEKVKEGRTESFVHIMTKSRKRKARQIQGSW